MFFCTDKKHFISKTDQLWNAIDQPDGEAFNHEGKPLIEFHQLDVRIAVHFLHMNVRGRKLKKAAVLFR